MKTQAELTQEDLELLEQQLGRRPKGVASIAARCRSGHPQVIVNHPVRVNGELEIFPTLYWLTCSEISKAVAHLEASGLIKELTEKYQHPDNAQLLRKAHEDYAAARMSLVPDAVKTRLRDAYPAQYKVLTKSGVGGTRPDSSGIKCLHTHLAHFLAGGNNPVGEEVWRRIKEQDYDLLCLKDSDNE